MGANFTEVFEFDLQYRMKRESVPPPQQHLGNPGNPGNPYITPSPSPT